MYFIKSRMSIQIKLPVSKHLVMLLHREHGDILRSVAPYPVGTAAISPTSQAARAYSYPVISIWGKVKTA